MNARYALRIETTDGTLEEAYFHMARKDYAIAAAKASAKSWNPSDVARIWVDDTKTGLGIKSFEVAP